MAIILRPSAAGGKRAEYITAEDADALVQAGDAVKCAGYGEVYEEPSSSEKSQGYLTRNMAPLLPPIQKAKKPPVEKQRAKPTDTPPEAA